MIKVEINFDTVIYKCCKKMGRDRFLTNLIKIYNYTFYFRIYYLARQYILLPKVTRVILVSSREESLIDLKGVICCFVSGKPIA